MQWRQSVHRHSPCSSLHATYEREKKMSPHFPWKSGLQLRLLISAPHEPDSAPQATLALPGLLRMRPPAHRCAPEVEHLVSAQLLLSALAAKPVEAWHTASPRESSIQPKPMEAPDAWPPAQHPSPAVAGAAQGPNPPGSPWTMGWLPPIAAPSVGASQSPWANPAACYCTGIATGALAAAPPKLAEFANCCHEEKGTATAATSRAPQEDIPNDCPAATFQSHKTDCKYFLVVMTAGWHRHAPISHLYTCLRHQATASRGCQRL
mmetsp:Transcript_3768/g.8768  ORF Transcript_3768/g.8768 Transcript_3768/m.8768 type:complete len:264 (-) Transcript_3768:427-1218(-)